MVTIPVDWLEATMLAAVRVTGFLVIAPPFSHAAIPLRIKGMLGVGIAVALAPRLVDQGVPTDPGRFILALITEVAVGVGLGFLVMLVFSAVQSAGNLIDLFGGFQLAQAFDPQSLVNGAQFTRIFHLTAMALLFATDGYQLIIGGLVRSFSAVPLGGGIDLSVQATQFVHGATQLFLASVQIAGPIVVILVLADFGLGLLTRVSPALNALQLGYPLKILITLSFAGIVFVAMPRIVAALGGDAVDLLAGVK